MKTLKQILIIALAFTLCCFAFAGCGEKSAYFEITVTYEDGTPVNGLTDGDNGSAIQIQICTDTNCYGTPFNLDKKGKCKIKIAELEEAGFTGDLQLHLNNTELFTDEDTVIINKDNPKIKIVLTEKK